MVIITTKKELNEFLDYESKKYSRKSTRKPFLMVRESDVLYKYIYILRKTEYYKNTNNRLMKTIYHYQLKRMSLKYSIHIPLNCFDKGLKIMHVGPVLINGKVKAGKDISLHINTSVVAGGSNGAAPVLGDGVILGVGSVILGDVNIANNVAIGANAVVNKSFQEENIAIAGVPAKKISNNGSAEWRKNVTSKK